MKKYKVKSSTVRRAHVKGMRVNGYAYDLFSQLEPIAKRIISDKHSIPFECLICEQVIEDSEMAFIITKKKLK